MFDVNSKKCAVSMTISKDYYCATILINFKLSQKKVYI